MEMIRALAPLDCPQGCGSKLENAQRFSAETESFKLKAGDGAVSGHEADFVAFLVEDGFVDAV
jgi:hypothetical protein